MRQRQSPTNYSRLKYYFLIFFVIALAFTALHLFDQYFMIRSVEIISSGEKPVVNGLENFKGKNILLTSEKDIVQTIVKNNPNLKNIRVEKKYPNQLLISMEAEGSVAALKVNQGYFILSLSGKILAKDKDSASGLPQINFYQQLNYAAYNRGDQIDLQNINISLHFSKKSKDMGLPVLSIDITGVDMIRLNIQNQKILVFSTKKNLDLQDYQFEKIIRQFKIEGQDFESLDFRFDKPIIKLK